MTRGRKPTPTRLKLITGSKRAAANTAEPMPTRGVPPCPEILHPKARAVWAELVPELDRLGLLTLIDRHCLAVYCQAWAEFELATEVLEKEGRYTKRGTGGLTSHPAIQQQRTAWKAIRDFAALFG